MPGIPSSGNANRVPSTISTPVDPTISTTPTTPTTPTSTAPGNADSFTVGSTTTTPTLAVDTTTPAGSSTSVLRARLSPMSSAGVSAALAAVLDANPTLKTNQDMLNFAFAQGGDLEGATAYLKGLGLEIEKLTESRNCPIVHPIPTDMQKLSILCALLRSNPDIGTNQEMINFAFEQGGDYAGAAEYLEGIGLDIGELLADRGAMLGVLQAPEDDVAVGIDAAMSATAVTADATEDTEDPLAALMRGNPGIKTNQDLINFAFEQGGDFSGASEYVGRLGVDMQELLADRTKLLPSPGPSPLDLLLTEHPDLESNQDFINLAFKEGGSFSGASEFAAKFGVSMDHLIANRSDRFDPALAAGEIIPGGDLDTPKRITADQLRQIVPHISSARATALVPHINKAMNDANINTPRRKAAFIAQIAHESDGFRTNEEYASGAAYEGRRDLGNTQRGDGRRFKGRGFIQLTGRSNYTRASRDLGVDLVSNPDFAKTNEGAAMVTAWFWNENNLNRYADRDDFLTLTRRINGGTNGLADRRAYHSRAKRIFGA